MKRRDQRLDDLTYALAYGVVLLLVIAAVVTVVCGVLLLVQYTLEELPWL